ncbi:hypothetical protein BDV59DRAFT_203660 [Aspergillus ambiguus]|uniref:uncharacterized protein n=1 Tax=Aspergillus ambiguus TaxID=176160 RepID=UPI003CCDAB55
MGHPTTVMVGTITALYDVGAVFGALFAAFTAERLGRKRGLIFGTAFLVIGSVLMGAWINIVSYYAPTLFKDNLGMTQERALFVGCFLQVWYILASFLTWYMIDRVGRRRLLISMGLAMCVILCCEAATVAVGGTHASIAAVFFVFAFEACFTWGWMTTTWIYPAEILPLKIRAKGAGIAAAADFLGNFLVVEITPPALENIGYRTYIIFAVFNIVAAAIVYCLYTETSYLNLEAIDHLFLPDEEQDQEIENNRKFHEKVLQWKIIPRARIAVNVAKARRGLDNVEAQAQRSLSTEKTEIGHVEVIA